MNIYLKQHFSSFSHFSFLILHLLFLFSFVSCTFDYGDSESSGENVPNLIMENVEYVRVRSADPLARIQAERVERFEKQSIMTMQNIIFEQYGERGEEVYVYGNAGYATVETDSGNVFMDNNVRIEVTTEDIILETYRLEWKDEPRSISTGENDVIYIFRDNGTNFTGTGFFADARNRTWEFLGNVRGTYIHDDKE